MSAHAVSPHPLAAVGPEAPALQTPSRWDDASAVLTSSATPPRAGGATTHDSASRVTSSQVRVTSGVSARDRASAATARSRTSNTKSAGEGSGPSARRCAGTGDDEGTADSTGEGSRSLQLPVSIARTSALLRAVEVVHSAVAASRSRASV